MNNQSCSSRVISDLQKLNTHFDRTKKSVLFTNGCFDLLHKGHIHLLKEARKLADIVIVGLNDDTSIRKLKGESRPIEPLSIRIEKIAALGLADFILPFSEDTPIGLIKAILPDIILKGGDYQAEDIVGAKEVMLYGGKVIIVPLLQGYSTTGIIESMK